ncbi:uncharacterized protein FOKN1_2927 [Thiohalobacter thiocyanaticus]|uniref:Uncharacterized protein n=1 Tax=Thiohalobacter thiocyanaticus TaxID=585455 RepID=A0A1Z4VVP5_9GAMM|nr:uncharacterized protein FOKN1_2927 [Thiohalobacter thiocyanaticus]
MATESTESTEKHLNFGPGAKRPGGKREQVRAFRVVRGYLTEISGKKKGVAKREGRHAEV